MDDLNHYFAYGSNLSSERLRKRVPEAVAISPARLCHWALCFDKHGRDGSAKASIQPLAGQEVWGMVYRIFPQSRGPLDKAEGLGSEYAMRRVRVEAGAGCVWSAYTYVALRRKQGLRIERWYLEHMLVGIGEHGLPDSWLQHVRALTGKRLR